MTHIKPDGTKNEIDLYDGIKVTTQIPKYYGYGSSSSTYYKIAIPDLEVGDILDFFEIHTYDNRIGNTSNIIASLSYPYPVVKQQVIFDVDKKG